MFVNTFFIKETRHVHESQAYEPEKAFETLSKTCDSSKVRTLQSFSFIHTKLIPQVQKL